MRLHATTVNALRAMTCISSVALAHKARLLHMQHYKLSLLQYRKRTEYLKGKHLERLALALPATKVELEGDAREGPSPGPPLAPTFDADDHSHLYRAFEPKQGDSAWLTR